MHIYAVQYGYHFPMDLKPDAIRIGSKSIGKCWYTKNQNLIFLSRYLVSIYAYTCIHIYIIYAVQYGFYVLIDIIKDICLCDRDG